MSEKIKLKGQLKLPVVGRNPIFAQMKFVKVALSEPDILPDSGSIFTCDEQGNYEFEIYTGAHLLSYNVGNAWSKPIEIIAEPLAEGLDSIEISDLIGFQEIPELDATIAALNQQKQELLAIQQDITDKQAAVSTAAASIDSTVADVEDGYPSMLAAQLSKSVTVNAAIGDDSTADGSSAKPFKTIKKAIESQPDRISLTINLAGSSQSSTHLIDSTILLLSRLVTISCSEQYIKISSIAGAYAFDVSDGGKMTIKASVRCHFYIESSESSTVLVSASGDVGGYLQNVNFYLSSAAEFHFIGYRTIKEHGISTLSTSLVNFIDYADKTSPTAGRVKDCEGLLSGAAFVQHHAGSFGSNYQNTMTESVISGTLKAVSK